MDEGDTPLLPDCLVYHIFLSLGPADVLAAGLVCRQWQAVSRDEFLWREQFYRYYQVARDVPRHPGQHLSVAPQPTRMAGWEARLSPQLPSSESTRQHLLHRSSHPRGTAWSFWECRAWQGGKGRQGHAKVGAAGALPAEA